MFRNSKSLRVALVALLAAGLLSGGLVWAKKPPKPPPEPPPPPPVTYAITWLDTLGGNYAQLYDLNDFGDVVGASNLPGDYETFHAYLNRAGDNGTRVVIDLNDLTGNPDWVLESATAINNVGQITGAAWVNVIDEWVQTSYRFTPGSTLPLEDLNTIGYGNDLAVHDINDQGVVVGDRPLPFRYTDDMEFLEDLAANSPWIFKSARCIDNAGRIVGEGEINGEPHAYRLTPETSVVEDLGFLDGKTQDMSDVGHVVGWFVAKTRGHRSLTHAFLFTPAGDMTDLGVLPDGQTSEAKGVNDLGQVIGRASDRRFLYLDGHGMLNVDDLIDPVVNSEETLLRWDLITTHWDGKINNPRLPGGSLDPQGYGQILGHTYLLTPVPPTE